MYYNRQFWTAENGYPVSELIANGWRTQEKKLRRDADWQSGDLDNGPEQPSGHELLIEGRAPRVGEIMRIPTLGGTMAGKSRPTANRISIMVHLPKSSVRTSSAMVAG